MCVVRVKTVILVRHNETHLQTHTRARTNHPTGRMIMHVQYTLVHTLLRTSKQLQSIACNYAENLKLIHERTQTHAQVALYSLHCVTTNFKTDASIEIAIVIFEIKKKTRICEVQKTYSE